MASLRLRVSTLRTDTLRGPDLVLKSDSDAGAGAEDTPNILITASDVGSGNDGGIPEDAFSASDVGAGAEGTEVLVVFIDASDTGSGNDGGTPAEFLDNSDTGTGAEGTPSVAQAPSDTGSGAETHTIGVASSDTAAGVDNHAIYLTGSDSGLGTDGPPSEFNTNSDTDTAAGTEGAPHIVFTAPNDTSSTQDDAQIAIAFFSSDAATATDSQTVDVVISRSDGGSGTDTQSLHEFFDVSDVATASDDLITFTRNIQDAAQGSEGLYGDRTLNAIDLGNGTTSQSVQKHGSAGNIYVGGLRARLIRDSLYQMIKDGLTNLEWFDPGRHHAPINWRESEVSTTEEIPLNTLALSDGDTLTQDWEMGSDMSEHSWDFFIDFYAEDSAVGIHLIRDVKDLLEGRFPSIGRVAPVFTVHDYSQANTPALFTCEIENVDVDKAHTFTKPWQKHWYAIALTVLDYYGNEND